MKIKTLILVLFSLSTLHICSAQQKKSNQKSAIYYVEFVNFTQKLLDYMDGDLFQHPRPIVNRAVFEKKKEYEDSIFFKPFNLIKDKKKLQNGTCKVLVKLKEKQFSIEHFEMNNKKWKRILMEHFDIKEDRKTYVGKQIADYISASVRK